VTVHEDNKFCNIPLPKITMPGANLGGGGARFLYKALRNGKV